MTRIRDWQELLGFSLDEVKAVLSTGDVDVLDRVHFELRDGEVSCARRRALLDEAIAANDQLVGRLEDTLARIRALRDERAAIAVRLRESRDELELYPGLSISLTNYRLRRVEGMGGEMPGRQTESRAKYSGDEFRSRGVTGPGWASQDRVRSATSRQP